MNTIDNTTKIFLLPEGVKSLQVGRLKFGATYQSVAISNGNVYELKEVGPSSKFDRRSEPQSSSGESIRSMIIEYPGEDLTGTTMSNAYFITFTAIDFVFPFLRWMSSHLEIYESRYHTSEDITEAFSVSVESPEITEMLSTTILDCIERACDSVSENGEKFFKFSLTKVNNLLKNKIDRLKSLLLDNPHYSLAKIIIESLPGASDEIPKAVLEQQIAEYCIDFIFDSYLEESMKKKFVEEFKENNLELKKYIYDHDSKQESINIAEQNLASIGANPRDEAGVSKKITKAVKPIKKQQPKVAKGKGALDQFFMKK